MSAEYKLVAYGNQGRTRRLYKFTCPKCNKTEYVDQRTYKKKVETGHPCGSCLHSEIAKITTKKYWNTVSNDERKKRIEKLNESSREYHRNLTDEQRKAISEERSKRLSDRMKKKWEDPEYVKHFLETRKKNLEKKRELNKVPQLRKPGKEINERIIKKSLYTASLLNKDNWNSIGKLERDKKIQRLKSDLKYLEKHMTSEERMHYSLAISEISKAINESKFNSPLEKLFIRFERMFSESHLVNSYYLKPNTDGWHYGIFNKETSNLEMLIDFENDQYPYQIKSKPENIKSFIVQEKSFTRCFESILQLIMVNYDQYVEMMFVYCRAMPFPDVQHSPLELLESYKSLKEADTIPLNSRIGDKLINHFHPSIYRARRNGELSPYEAWYIDELLLKVIKNRIVYQTYLNPNKILQGFNISKVAQKVSVFSAGRAKLLIQKYLNQYTEVFDPFSGFSGRLLGTISLNKKYIGQDISLVHTNESIRLINFLRENGINVDAEITRKDILKSKGTYQCLFTCSPYGNIEQWRDVPVDNRSCDDWIDECLSRFNCNKYLFVVDHTDKYGDYVVETISNRSHLSKNSESVILINKEDMNENKIFKNESGIRMHV